MTPPLMLRTDEGDREVVSVDEEFTATTRCVSVRTTAILELAAGVRVTVGSRSINKRRVTVLRIGAADSSFESTALA